MKIAFRAAPEAKGIVAVLVFEGGELGKAASRIDEATGGALQRAVGAGRFSGERDTTLAVVAPAGLDADQVLMVGAGAKGDFDAAAAEACGARAYAAVKLSGATTLSLDFDADADQAARAAFGARLAAYRFDQYRTTQKADKKPSIEAVTVVSADDKAATDAFESLSALADAIFFARDLVSEPANVLYPASFAERCKGLERLGLKVEVLGEAEMEKLGMRTLLAVGQGSERESQLVVMRWDGAPDAKTQPIAFVGKGVCFDTGGISLKPADGMEEMKWDMGGAAAVAGLMHALAGRKAKANVIGVLGLVENMPDGRAQRPGDVVMSMSGQSVEIINTDAEGRLVLADALWYTQERFKPKFMVDLATLTGAMIISLGLDYAGVFSNSDELADNILDASRKSGENAWRMPIPPSYDRMIDSPIADVKNASGRPAGSITAALFLQRFTNKVPWAHIDIAPTAWVKDSRRAIVPDGATGFGVRLLDQMVADHYEA